MAHDELGWGLVYTNPSAEDFLKTYLRRTGFRVFLPLYRKLMRGVRITADGRRVRSRGVGDLVMRPVFPRYLFVELEPDQPWQSIKTAPGAHSLIMNTVGHPARLRCDFIEHLRWRVDNRDFDESKIPESHKEIMEALARKELVHARVPAFGYAMARLLSLDENGRARFLMQAALGRDEVITEAKIDDLRIVSVA